MKELNAAQVEAIDVADANLNNADLPLYSNLMKQRNDLLDLLNAAVARVQIANSEGNPILSAWVQDASAMVQTVQN